MTDDLISREKAIWLYCRENCGWEPEKCPLKFEQDGTEECSVVRFLKELPSAQPEIITCKDCKNWDTTWQNDWAKDYHYCPLVDGTRKGDWYCADAERRTE